MPRFEGVYLAFFDAYDRYRAESAAWDAKWGERYGSSQPGYVAVHGAAGPTIATSLNAATAGTVTSQVVDPDTGAQIPVVNLPAATGSTPVVQPVPKEQAGTAP